MMLLLIALISSGNLTADERYPVYSDSYRSVYMEPANIADVSGETHWLADNDGQFYYAGGNPWALPQTKSEQDAPANWRSEQDGRHDQSVRTPDRRENNWNSAGGRFVTPEILESLEKQQTQAQQVYPQQVYPGYLPRQNYPQQNYTGGYNPGNYYPGRGSYYGATRYGTNWPMYTSPYSAGIVPYAAPYGMNYYDPIYDAPAISPWLAQPDPLLGGGALDYVPDEAVGGIAPLEMSGFSPVLGYGVPGMNNRLFNPYNFLNDMK